MIKTDWLYLKRAAFLCEHHTSWHIAADVCSCGRHTFCCMTDRGLFWGRDITAAWMAETPAERQSTCYLPLLSLSIHVSSPLSQQLPSFSGFSFFGGSETWFKSNDNQQPHTPLIWTHSEEVKAFHAALERHTCLEWLAESKPAD